MRHSKNAAAVGARLHLLLIGEQERGFLRLGHLLAKTCNGEVLLEHVSSPSAALAHLQQTACDLVLCDYKSGDAKAIQLLQNVRDFAPRIPIVFLSDHINETAVTQIAREVISNRQPANPEDEFSLERGLCSAINAYCRENQRQKTEDMLRKLWHAVEQTTDLIVITDRSGIIEYVNPAFAALTGYSREEARGANFSHS